MTTSLRILLLSLILICFPSMGQADTRPYPGDDVTTVHTIHWNKGRGYSPFRNITPEGLLLSANSDSTLLDSVRLTVPYGGGRLRFRTDNRHALPRKSYRYTTSDGTSHSRKNPPWAIFLTDTSGNICWLTISKSDLPTDDLAEDTSGTALSVDFNDTPAFHTTVKDPLLPFSGETLWTIELADGKLRVIAGAHEPTEIADIPLQLNGLASFGFAASPAAEILISDISLAPVNQQPSTAAVLSGTQPYATASPSSDPLEGTYEIFDRTLEESLLRLGGEYKLAVVKNHDRYDIIYLSGAKINSGRWKPGMLKGVLTPTSFDGIYNLEWYDAEGLPLSRSITAQWGYGSTLTLQFPYQSSTIRLRKTN